MINAINKIFSNDNVKVLPGNVKTVNVIFHNTKSRCTAFTVMDVYKHVNKLTNEWQNKRKGNKVYSVDVNSWTYCLIFRGRFLPNRNIGLVEYGIDNNDDIILSIKGLLVGGSEHYVHEPVWKNKCISENPDAIQVRNERYRKVQAKLSKRQQALLAEVQSVPTDIVMKMQEVLSKMKDLGEAKYINIIEDVLLFSLQLYKSKDAVDISLAVLTLVKLRTQSSLTTTYAKLLSSVVSNVFDTESIFEDADGFEIQSAPVNTEQMLEGFRAYMNDFESVAESELGKKYTLLFKNLVSLGMLEFMGVKPTPLIIKGMRVSNTTWVDYASLAHCVADTASLTALRAAQALKNIS